MKRSTKIMMLAAALALCLVLTGCYQAPDDVNNGGATNGGDILPFPTLAPTATVTMTPDTVTVETPDPASQGQNIFPVATATPTPAPDGTNNWNNWGNTGTGTGTGTGTAPTAVPTGGTIVFATADPSATNGAGTGVIQTVTGTPTLLAPTTPAVATPSPTPLTMRLGFTGEAVRTVQRRLKELGYYTGSIDGDFGAATDKAIKEFQKANGLTADGKVGEQTLKKLNDKNAKTYKQAHATAVPKNYSTAKPTARPTATPNLTREYYLRLGNTGSRVETLQRRLIELGWLSGKVTGSFDLATETALRAFQDATSGIYTDGVAGPATLRALYSSGAARSKTPAAANAVATLEFGSEGSEVVRLQQRLQALGYLAGNADGKFGVATQAAVMAFQRNNNLTADGKAGSATQSKLYGGTSNRASGNAANISSNNSGGRDTSGIASTGYETLQFGSEGDAVRRLQNKLQSLGYSPGYTDGKFGASTEAAVMAFQSNNNLTVDGKAGPATQRRLYGTSANSAVTYSSLREGDRGEAVRNLQYTLYELGYYDGSIDGIYGATTSDAVRAFQIMNKLEKVDGIAGSKTMAVLYSSGARAATTPADQYSTVRPGDTGEAVVEIQEVLNEFGFLGGVTITGTYDDATKKAVEEFQKNNSLKVDGICGPETLSVLFGY